LLFIGVNRLTLLLLEGVADLWNGNVRVAGIVALDAASSGRKLNGFDVFGSDNLGSTLQTLSVHGLDVDRILITVSRDLLPKQVCEALRKVTETTNVHVEYLSNALGLMTSPNISRDSSLALCPALQELTLDPDQIKRVTNARYWAVKRTLDVVASAPLLVLIAPAWLLLVVVVRSSLGSPVYFWQVRPGRYGRSFKLVKFRTLTNAYDVNGRPIDMADRLGRVGRFLRKTRLDELPQMWNVFIGEMSFIGPRPLLPADQTAGASRRHLVRPGLTGYAQVMGGRDISPADKMALDIWYVMNASLALDLKIIARTVPMIMFGECVNHEAIRKAWSDLRSGSPVSRGRASRYLSWRTRMPSPKLVSDSRGLTGMATHQTTVSAHERRSP